MNAEGGHPAARAGRSNGPQAITVTRQSTTAVEGLRIQLLLLVSLEMPCAMAATRRMNANRGEIGIFTVTASPGYRHRVRGRV